MYRKNRRQARSVSNTPFQIYLILITYPYSVGVYVGAGVRNEAPESNGAGNLLMNMALRGTTTRSKTELAAEIENMGAQYAGKVDKE